DCKSDLCGIFGWDCQDPSSICFEGLTEEIGGFATKGAGRRGLETDSSSDLCQANGGNGECEADLNNKDCDHDGGDCCECQY
ncbi:unnamed protein product, partial [Ascophyllum nodosum]